MQKTINEHMNDLCDFTEHFINQEMPDRAKEGDPWEQVVKDRLAAEIADNQDYKRVTAALILERHSGVKITSDEFHTERVQEFLDALAANEGFDEFIQAMANALFDYTMQGLTQRGEAVMLEIFNQMKSQEDSE